MTNKKEEHVVDDIISMLDNFVSDSVGHVNITINNNDINAKNIKKANSLDCNKNMACQVPTFDGASDLEDK